MTPNYVVVVFLLLPISCHIGSGMPYLCILLNTLLRYQNLSYVRIRKVSNDKVKVVAKIVKAKLKGSQQQGALVHFSSFRENAKNIFFGNSQNMYVFLAKTNKICFKIMNSGDFAMMLLLKVRKS